MHRATPLATSFRSYVSGGSRSVVDKVDDSKLMQEMGGNFMKNETRSAVESPQNYGFTSVVFDAEKDAMGKIIGSAETFIGFMGGNRSFPVAGNMDDRRHRLKGLEKGDTAMFRGKDDQQQFHMTGDGGFWSAPDSKTVRLQLVPAKQQQQQSAQQFADGAAGGSTGGAQGGQQQQQGQKPVYKDGQDSAYYMDVTKDKSRVSGKKVHLLLDDKKAYVDVNGDDKIVYLGAEKGQAQFDFVVTLSGPSVNVKAKIG